MSEYLQQSAQLESTRPQIAILDFGSQYSHLIARRVRQLNVYCELYSCLVTRDVLDAKNIVGVILSGGPSSVYDEGSPHVDTGVSFSVKSPEAVKMTFRFTRFNFLVNLELRISPNNSNVTKRFSSVGQHNIVTNET